MQGKAFLLSLLCIVIWTKSSESLDCFECSNVHNVTECRMTTTCAADEQCYTDAHGLGNNAIFNLGCRPFQQCLKSSTLPPISIVGRDIDDRRATTDCEQCCSVDYCNKNMCNHATEVITSTDGQCRDDPDYNCQLISGTFNICGDVHHAKSVCRKFCGLCDLVDGKWSAWETWSKCDVSCGEGGHRSRIRTCTDPKPSSGGLDCVGNHVDIANCSLNMCPVHGGWSTWSDWGSCSVTCGVGLQRRDRSCSSPYPGPDGNPCFGDARDDRSCFLRACVDGNWADWTQWGTCSATCNGGMTTRSRTCDNPPPSAFGKECVGNFDSYALCNTRACPDPIVFFSVHSPTRTFANGIPLFSNVIANVGGGYDKATGCFTCSIPGMYHFSVTFMAMSNSRVDVYCYIRHNSVSIVAAYTTTVGSNGIWQTASASTYLSLALGDTVDLGRCRGWSIVDPGRASTFTGALITSS